MQSLFDSNEKRAILVCVDSCRDKVWKGSFYNAYLQKGENFSSLADFLVKTETVLDRMHFAKSFSSVRRFTDEEETENFDLTQMTAKSGKEATFVIRILFRQNASWQGSVQWLEGKKEESFRSVLELVFLMNDALPLQESSRTSSKRR